jgi:hypothetical protein
MAIVAVSAGIAGGIACDKQTGSPAISTRSDAGSAASDLGKKAVQGDETPLVRAVEFATGANHDSPDVDWQAIDDVHTMWSIASITTAEQAAKVFAASRGNAAEPIPERDRPSYTDCEASRAEPSALNGLLPVLFQHRPVAEATSHWSPLRNMVAGADLVRVTCAEAPNMVVAVHDGRVVAAREMLDAGLELEPRGDAPESDEPEPGGPPPATIEVSSPVEGARIAFDADETELPHRLTGVDTSKTLRFKVKAPGHLDAEVGALPMDVLTMLQGGEPQSQFEWVVWPNPEPGN